MVLFVIKNDEFQKYSADTVNIIIMMCWNISLTVDTCTGLSEKRKRGGGERRLDVDILLVSGLLLFSLDSGRDACV